MVSGWIIGRYHPAALAAAILVLTLTGVLLVAPLLGGAPFDHVTASFLRTGCWLGHGGCCNNLGLCHLWGFCSMEEDEEEAAPLFKRSCDLRRGTGCNNLGKCYLYGDCGLRKEPMEAVHLFRLACDLEIPEGCFNLAGCYLGLLPCDLPHDWVEAKNLLQKGCSLGLQTSCQKALMMEKSGSGLQSCKLTSS